MPVCQFKIQLKDLNEPAIWRRLLVPPDIPFGMFHEIIQVAFGWQNYHLYQFSPKGWSSQPLIQPQFDDGYDDNETIDSEEITLAEIFTHARQTFVYIYDFGDDWMHQVKLEKITDQVIGTAVCTGGGGACPPEDCGGIWGYMNLLEVLANPKHPDHKEMREWLGLAKGEQWDANAFDIEAVNEELRTMYV